MKTMQYGGDLHVFFVQNYTNIDQDQIKLKLHVPTSRQFPVCNHDYGETKLIYWQKAETKMEYNCDFISQLNWLRICFMVEGKVRY